MRSSTSRPGLQQTLERRTADGVNIVVDMESSTVKRTDILSASPKMFDNRLLDSLSRVHPVVPPLIFLPGIVLSYLVGEDRIGIGSSLISVVLGYILLTLSDY